MPSRDHYAALGVTPSATEDEIETAFRQLRSRAAKDKALAARLTEIEYSYTILSQPHLKQRYDSAIAEDRVSLTERAKSRSKPAPGMLRRLVPLHRLSKRAQVALSLVLLAVLVASTWMFVWPHVSWRLYEHAPGSELVHVASGRPLGKVLRFEAAHEFPRGIVAAAYELQLSDGRRAWMPKWDVNRIAQQRTASY